MHLLDQSTQNMHERTYIAGDCHFLLPVSNQIMNVQVCNQSPYMSKLRDALRLFRLASVHTLVGS